MAKDQNRTFIADNNSVDVERVGYNCLANKIVLELLNKSVNVETFDNKVV